jgi:hypothetical protein
MLTATESGRYDFGIDYLKKNETIFSPENLFPFFKVHTITSKAAVRRLSNLSCKMSSNVVLDPFALRQFDTSKPGCLYASPEEFAAKVDQHFTENTSSCLVDGYAPFCKHIFMPNFTEAKASVVAVSGNESLIHSDYVARTEAELPVLDRWIPLASITLKKAEFLDIILYSREQIRKENEAMGSDASVFEENAPWGIVSVKPQNVEYELPMTPITMMRNALGKDEGGSGVPLVREKYIAAVEYWKSHVAAK